MFNLRRHFMLDPKVTFLNHGSFGATPRPVFHEYQTWQRELERQPVEFFGRRATQLLSEARAELGNYLRTGPDNLVFTTNVTVSVNIVARSLDLGPGDEVLATDHEYGAMDRTWRYLSKKRGFTYKVQAVPVPLMGPDVFITSLWKGVTRRTRVIFLSHITSPTALIFPVKEVVKRARSQGILTVVDGAHAPGQVTLDLDDLGADFYGGNLHKWLCAPKGAGFLYAASSAQHLLEPLVVSWGYEPELPGPSPFVDLFEWGGTRDLAAFLSVSAAIEFQQEHSWYAVRTACHALLESTVERINRLTGLPRIAGEADFIQMASVCLPGGVDIDSLKHELYDDYRIEVPLLRWNGMNLIRISIQGYNTPRDAEKLVSSLQMILRA